MHFLVRKTLILSKCTMLQQQKEMSEWHCYDSDDINLYMPLPFRNLSFNNEWGHPLKKKKIQKKRQVVSLNFVVIIFKKRRATYV
jgi:hypothetical protein